ncbi:hypothetical protein GCM10007304_18180 [Rhodococcoides trifolii]|uniref:Uncharacterized protein n=1 Tax=Rhodococcoides trifolii TaxID=908250 RepID=A0A917FVG9_9NOCA|nr:hypothetical protein [Rhodococcus trifolii]GGG04436.1 hypothetical protein GCM10007304_18180 [Rhodococcus trifolii]
MTGRRPDTVHDRIADDALALAVAIRDEDPVKLYNSLILKCRNQPEKAAQIMMALAAFTPVDEPVLSTIHRVEAIVDARVAVVRRVMAKAS